MTTDINDGIGRVVQRAGALQKQIQLGLDDPDVLNTLETVELHLAIGQTFPDLPVDDKMATSAG